MLELLAFISNLVGIYTFVVFLAVVLSWLIGFNIINGYNPFVRTVYQAVSALTEPLLGRIRRILPNLGAIDLSPLVLLLGCQFVQSVIIPNLAKLVR
jgi:YggT family protein